MNDNLEVEVFRAGDYGEKGVWSEAHLDQMAADYNPALHEAPVTLDHAQSGPALGWVAALRRVGDRLVATLRGVSGKLLDLLGAGAFRKRSVELYPSLRETGRPYLRAVSFLGAAVPEVKGLADPAFDENGESRSLRLEATFETDEMPHTETDMQSSGDSFPIQDPPASPEAAHVASSRSDPPSGRRALHFSDVAARLRGSGRWRPAWAERGIAEFYAALAQLEDFEFAEGERIAPADWFAAFLESLPPIVTLGETAPAAGLDLDGLLGGSAVVDPDSLKLHRAAAALVQSSPGLSYAEALARCSRQA